MGSLLIAFWGIIIIAPCYKKTIVDYLWKKHSIELDEDQIQLDEPLNNWGEYLIPIDLGVGEILKLDVVFSSFRTKTKKPATTKE